MDSETLSCAKPVPPMGHCDDPSTVTEQIKLPSVSTVAVLVSEWFTLLKFHCLKIIYFSI